MSKLLEVSISRDEAIEFLNKIYIFQLVNGLVNARCIKVSGKIFYSASLVISNDQQFEFICRSEHRLYGRNLFRIREIIFIKGLILSKYEDSGGGEVCEKIDKLVEHLKRLSLQI